MVDAQLYRKTLGAVDMYTARRPRVASRRRAVAAAAYIFIGLAALLWLYTHFVGLSSSILYDESFSIHHYVDPGPRGALFGTYEPNDHILYELLAWMTVNVFGRAEAIYRLASVVPAALGSGVLVYWTWRRVDRWTAVSLAWLLACLPLLTLETIQARGYGLVFVGMTLLVIGAADLVEHGPSPRREALVVLGIVVGVGTYPMVGVGAALALAVVFSRRCSRASAIRTSLVSVALVGLLYAPLVPQMAKDFNDNYLHPSARKTAVDGTGSRPPLPWHSVISGPALLLAPSGAVLSDGDVYRDCVSQCVRGGKLVLYGGVPLAVAVVGFLSLWRRRRALALLLGVPIVGGFVLLTIARLFVADRFTLFLLVPLVLLVSLGFTAAVRWLRRWPVVAAAVVCVALMGGSVMTWRMVRVTTSWAEKPAERYEEAATLARAADVPILTNSVRPAGLWFYLGTGGVQVVRDSRQLAARLCSGRPYAFVQHLYKTPAVPTTCMVRANATKLTLSQPTRGGFVIWISGGGGGITQRRSPGQGTDRPS